MRFRSVGLALGALVLSTVGGANAQEQGFALNRFEPSERGSEWFAQDTLDFRGRARPAIGVVGDWGYKPLVAFNADDSERAAIVRHQIFAHVGASMVFFERLRLGVNLPIAAYQTGTGTTVNGRAYTPPDGAALGDLRIGADVRLLGQYGQAFVLAAGLQAWMPTGSRSEYTSDGTVRLTPRVQVAGDIAQFAYAARVGFNWRTLSESFADSKVGSELSFGASLGLRFLDRKLLVGPELYGSTVVDKAFERKTTPFEVILGAHYTAGNFRVGAGVGPGITRGFGSPAWRTLLSLEWVPAIEEKKALPGDRDGDGIADEKDACPDVRGIATGDPKTNGCPPDKDGDGIYDADDACIDAPGVKSDDPKKNGCPLPTDKDGDGIVDAEDACVDVAGVKSDDPKKNGCPPDKDGDGIADARDACPDVAGVNSEDPKKNGCPPDTDGDSIVDPEDACPNTPGPKNADPKKNGCPAVAIEKGEIKILQQVKFKTNSAEILKESDEILSAVAKILKDHPELKKIKVEGHTDNKGEPKHNLDLSKRRAASVVKWLTTKGKIDAKRLSSEGYGEEKPIDSNETEAGRQNNRRVEFHILETSEATGGAKVEPATKPKK